VDHVEKLRRPDIERPAALERDSRAFGVALEPALDGAVRVGLGDELAELMPYVKMARKSVLLMNAT
jgi:hypothetical protein